MIENIYKLEFLFSLKSLLLGAIVGGIFAFFKFKPPSPENISGLLGIVGIYIGWWIVTHFLTN